VRERSAGDAGDARRAAAARRAELERRIAELEAQDDAAFGAFGRGDWLLCAALAVGAPALALLWLLR
jgi:hypothetical protein